MIARNVTIQDLEQAMVEVNTKYDNNIQWNRPPEKQGRGFAFTLRVKSSKGPGHRLSVPFALDPDRKQRRLISACWHVHGDFFDHLWEINPEAVIVTQGGHNGRTVMEGPYDNWQDFDIGSMMSPCLMSDACECYL